MKRLLGKVIGTFAAKSAAVKAAATVAAAALAVAPVAVNYTTASSENQPVQEATVETTSVGGVEGTKNLDEFMNEDGSLKNATDVSKWTDKDLEKANAEKAQAKKEEQQKEMDAHLQNWSNITAASNQDTAVKTDDTADETKPEESKNNSTPQSSTNNKSDGSKKDIQYATPGTTGPNGELVGDISTMPGYSDEGTAEKEKQQEEMDNHPQNWNNLFPEEQSKPAPSVEETPIVEETPVVEETPIAEETPVIEETPAEPDTKTDDSNTVVVGPSPSGESSDDSNSEGELLGKDDNTHNALKEAFQKAQEALNETASEAQLEEGVSAETQTE